MKNLMLKRRRLHRAYRTVLATPEGQVVLADLREFAAMNRTVRNEELVRFEGRRDVYHRARDFASLPAEVAEQLAEQAEGVFDE